MAKTIPAPEFKVAVKALNTLLKEEGEKPIKMVGVKKDDIVEAFTTSVLDFIDNDNAEALPDEVINLYNDYIVGDEDGEDEEPVVKKSTKKKPAGKKPAAKKPADKKPADKKPAAKKPAGPKVGAEIIKAIVDNDNCLDRKKVLEEVAKVFPDRNKDGMRTTVNHVVGVMTNYFAYAKK